MNNITKSVILFVVGGRNPLKVEKKVEGYNEEMWIEKKWSCVHVVKRRKCVKVATNVEVEYVKAVRVV